MKRVLKNGHVMLAADEHFNRFDVEAWIIGKLGNPPHITEGDTTFEQRRERIYALVLQRGIAHQPVTDKTRQDWSQVLKRFYGIPIYSNNSREGKHHVLPA